LDDRSAGSFNVAAKIDRKKAIKRKNALAQKEIDKIKVSEECSKIFPQTLTSQTLSAFIKLDSIKGQLRREIRNFKIPEAQIEFADELVTELTKQFPEDETLASIKASISFIKRKKKITVEVANAINKAIVSHLNSKDSLKGAVKSLDLSKTELKAMLSCANGLSSLEILKLDFSIESADSIISFIEGVRKIYIAKAQIHFADVLIVELGKIYPNEGVLHKIKVSVASIKAGIGYNLVEKADAINKAIVDHLNSDDSPFPFKSKITSLNLRHKGLKAILPCFSEFLNLFYLDFSHNQLSELPESLGRLINLKNLSLSDNQLVELPKFIGDLKNLVNLNLSNNQLVELPKSIIDNLKMLGDLVCYNNQLVYLPDPNKWINKFRAF